MYEGPENIAAIIMEGVTGSNGIIVPPDDYWPRVREICDKHGILLISDEVMSGWGRTGKWFAVDNWGVTCTRSDPRRLPVVKGGSHDTIDSHPGGQLGRDFHTGRLRRPAASTGAGAGPDRRYERFTHRPGE
jgi:hypothetical protein